MEEREEGKGIGIIIATIAIVGVALILLIGLLVRGVDFTNGSPNNTVDYVGVIEIEVGRVHTTWWFNFTIHSAEAVYSYAGHTAAYGHQLWEVVITQTGTFIDPIPMGTFGWFMDDNSFRADIFPHMGFEGRDEMMPEDFWLNRGQSKTHTMLFEVPSDTTNLTLNFIEIGQIETGARFMLNLQ
ncbi:MAG: hypothetical protein FWC76_03180 [Defluviitaleaceae bacterium]|nr:hypothetical protein [Defluviitaleaceae bacterium]